MPAGEQGALLEAARGAGRYPRIRFILVADNMEFPVRGGLASDLMAGLNGGSGPSGWPSNALLYVGATPSSTISYDPVVSRFGLVLTTGGLSEEQFGTTLSELAAASGNGTPAAAPPAEFVAGATQWAKARGGLTVRNAWMALNAAK